MELALKTHDAHEPAASLAEVDRLLEEIDRIADKGPLWHYGMAVRLKLEAGQAGTAQRSAELLDKAMEEAEKAHKQRLSWSPPHVLQGEICREKGKNEEALQHYLQASINGDRDPQFIRLLLQMLYERQRYQDAREVIHRLESTQTSLTSDIIETEANIFVRWGDFEKAKASANRAYNPASNDYQDHLWYGQMMTRLARRAQQEGHRENLPEIQDKAEKALLSACRIAPNTPACHMALVDLLVATNQLEKARQAASDAKDMIPPEVSPLAMGFIYEELGEPQNAGPCYEKAVQLKPDLPGPLRLLAEFYVHHHQLQRAAPLVERLLSGAVQSSESDLASARRMKAEILASEGYLKLKEANALIDRNLASPLVSSQDKRLKVRFLLADPHSARGPQVLALAESLVSTGGAEPEPEDRFLLAHIYLDRGDWKRCQEQMGKLVNGGQRNSRDLEAYVRMLLDRDELSDAQRWLDQLDRLSPGTIHSSSTASVSFHAELLFRGQHSGDVPGFLRAYVDQESADPKDQLDRMLVAAKLLEQLGDRLTGPRTRELAQGYFDKAGEWYRRYNQKRPGVPGAPGGEMLLAGFYARHGKLSQALDLLDRFGAKASPADLRNAAVAVIHCETITSQQLQQVEKVLASAAAAGAPARGSPSIPLLDAQHFLKIGQEKFADAEDFCRQIIAQAPNNYRAHNNLGVLLAFSGNKPDEALAMVNRAIDLAGPRPELLDSRAQVHIARNEPQQALEDLASIVADKVDPVWLFHKARALMLEGQRQGAAAALLEARNKGLERAMIDLPERPLFDQLRQQLAKPEDEN